MKNIRTATLDKYAGNDNYEHVEGNVYKDLAEDHYVFALSYELEDGEDSQYPLEDILDRFLLHVSDFVDEDAFGTATALTLELGGDLDDVREAVATIIGKRAYNEEYTDDRGDVRVKLVIE